MSDQIQYTPAAAITLSKFLSDFKSTFDDEYANYDEIVDYFSRKLNLQELSTNSKLKKLDDFILNSLFNDALTSQNKYLYLSICYFLLAKYELANKNLEGGMTRLLEAQLYAGKWSGLIEAEEINKYKSNKKNRKSESASRYARNNETSKTIVKRQEIIESFIMSQGIDNKIITHNDFEKKFFKYLQNDGLHFKNEIRDIKKITRGLRRWLDVNAKLQNLYKQNYPNSNILKNLKTITIKTFE